MTDARDGLTVWTPLPPERNGIADYAHTLLGALATHYDCRAACEDWLACAPAGIPVLDAAVAHRGAGPRVLHQIGNNPGHAFVLRALRQVPGVVTLHDPGLLYLYETAGEGAAAIRAGMLAAMPGLAEAYGRQHRADGVQTRANHLLFDLAGETLARSRAVVVHSEYARNRLRLVHGPDATAHVSVIPHFLPPTALPDRAQARARLGLGRDEFVVLTAGFATAAKRFDWLIEALDLACAAGARLCWIHAGAERPEEYALSAAIAERPALADRARVTGYLDEAALDDHIAAADVLVNLRFPSSGESSGSLARALAAGTCCIVSDTAAYAELPRDAVLQVPLTGVAPVLARALLALAEEPARAVAIGERGRRHARAEMALPAVAARYRTVIEDLLGRPVAGPAPAGPPPLVVLEADPRLQARAVAAALAGMQGRCRLLLATPDLAALARLTLDRPGLLAEVLPIGAQLRAAEVAQAPRAGLLLDLELGVARMTAAPVLAGLLREALPDAAVLDLGLPAGEIFPWWPSARCGVAEPGALPPAEVTLLRRFRQGPAGLPVFGLDAAADSALLAGAAAAFGAPGPQLLVLYGPTPPALAPLLEAGAMVLQRGRTEGMPPPPGPERGRIMLLGGSVTRIERWDLLVPPEAVAPLFDRLHVAAHRLAATLGGSGQWQVGGRAGLPSLASLGMLAAGPERSPPLLLPAAALLHDLPGLVARDALPLREARRLRLLLGTLPPRPAWLRLRLRGVDLARPPALFLDGQRLDEAQCRMEGDACVLEAPVTPRPDLASIVGLVLPEGAPPGLAVLGLGVGP